MGPGLQPSPEAFRASYVAYSTSIYEAQEGRGMHQGREHMMYGGYSESSLSLSILPAVVAAFLRVAADLRAASFSLSPHASRGSGSIEFVCEPLHVSAGLKLTVSNSSDGH